MAEFHGSEWQIAIQERLLQRQDWIEATPSVANGGRVFTVVDPEDFTWDRVKQILEEDGVVTLVAQPAEETLCVAKDRFGDGYQYPTWNVYIGNRHSVLEACEDVSESVEVPDGWSIRSTSAPSDDEIEQVQRLNLKTGIAPYPAYYSRGDVVPCVTTLLWNDDRELVGTASANYRFHEQGRFGGYVFEGSVSVSPICRGMGLGKFLTATVLIASQAAFGWQCALAQARPDNIPSRHMLEACGLRLQDGLATISAVKQELGSFTR